MIRLFNRAASFSSANSILSAPSTNTVVQTVHLHNRRTVLHSVGTEKVSHPLLQRHRSQVNQQRWLSALGGVSEHSAIGAPKTRKRRKMKGLDSSISAVAGDSEASEKNTTRIFFTRPRRAVTESGAAQKDGGATSSVPSQAEEHTSDALADAEFQLRQTRLSNELCLYQRCGADATFAHDAVADGNSNWATNKKGSNHTAVTTAEDAVSPAHRQQEAYSRLLEESIINPFNRKRLQASSPTAALLASLGFVRHSRNPFFLEWRHDIFTDKLRATLHKLEEAVIRSYKKQLHQYEKEKCSRNRRKKESFPGAPPKISAVPSVDDALDVLLRPLERGGKGKGNEVVDAALDNPGNWKKQLSAILRSPNAATVIPQHLEQLYADITTSSVMPPKLDASALGSPAQSSDDAAELVVLTVDQSNTLHLAVQGYSLFIGGSAGTGKTVLLRQIYKRLTQMGLRVAMTATTGVAAVQLGGCTFHHAFNAPILAGGAGVGGMLSGEVTQRRWDQTALRAVDVVVIDEASLLDAQTVDAFDMEARLARMSSAPFGGIQVIFCGDFLQLSIGIQDALPAYLSSAFSSLMKLRLETPMRHREKDPLLPLLNKLRRGKFDADAFQLLDKPIPEDSNSTTTFIFPCRRDAQKLNEIKLSELVTMEKMFVPQRGPLRLSGRFTSSALIEMGSGQGMPSRNRVLALLRDELVKYYAQKNHLALCLDSSSEGTAQLLALSGIATAVTDTDVVVMPAQALPGGSTVSPDSFFLRVRFPDTNGPNGDTLVSHPSLSGMESSVTTSSARGDDPAERKKEERLLDETTPQAHPSASSPSSAAVMTNTRRRAGLLTSLLDREGWKIVAESVARHLSARVVSFFDEEPRSLLPLSMTMALADMTNNDIAQTLAPLRLKLGCRVMVTRNLSRRVSNGSVGTVEAFADPDPTLFPQNRGGASYVRSPLPPGVGDKYFDKLPIVRLQEGGVVQIPPIPFHIGGTPLTYYYGHDIYSVPLQLGYAFTVHKVQGLTLSGNVVLDCENFFDCPHLVYVACSRVSSMGQLIVKNIRPQMVIVKQSALDFTDTLLPASNLLRLVPSSSVAKGYWTQFKGAAPNK